MEPWGWRREGKQAPRFFLWCLCWMGLMKEDQRRFYQKMNLQSSERGFHFLNCFRSDGDCAFSGTTESWASPGLTLPWGVRGPAARDLPPGRGAASLSWIQPHTEQGQQAPAPRERRGRATAGKQLCREILAAGVRGLVLGSDPWRVCWAGSEGCAGAVAPVHSLSPPQLFSR